MGGCFFLHTMYASRLPCVPAPNIETLLSVVFGGDIVIEAEAKTRLILSPCAGMNVNEERGCDPSTTLL